MRRQTICVLLLMTCSVNLAHAQPPVAKPRQPAEIPRALFNYVQKAEPAYAWKLNESRETKAGVVHDIQLTSQTWHGMTWKHTLHIYEPKLVRHPNHVLLFVNGGSNGKKPGDRSVSVGLTLANLTGARIASLYQVPNQPLFDDRYEDDLITETWLKYLQTGDESWPLLFPMVKSAVKAMDAVQEIATQKWDTKVEGFVITGASKRGWTSWLTPVADKRVVATAPIVIDTLNFRAQIKHQHDVWGKFSEQIQDYTRKGLVKLENESERERNLRRMMDPWTYRDTLTLPKLIINGANDRYWCADALNNYWDGLKGPKYALQLPNSGHGLDGNVELATRTLSVFFESIVTKTPLPKLDWSYDDAARKLTLTCDPKPRTVRLWTSRSKDHDFRDDQWTSAEISVGKLNQYIQSIALEEGVNTAVFAEASFGFSPLDYSLTTQIWRVK